MEMSSRHQVLARYRSLRERGKHHHEGALRRLSTSAIVQQAKRLGLLVGGQIVLDSDDEMNYVCDLALYAAQPGRTRAIERYVRTAPVVSGSDDEAVLQAMLKARFSLWSVESRHETAGLALRDLIRDEAIWLIDEGLEATASLGMILATRIISPDMFSMTCGASVTVDKALLEDVLDACQMLGAKSPEAAVEDRRFATAIFRLKLQTGIDVLTSLGAVA